MGPCPRVTLHRLPQRPFDQGAFPAAGGAGFYPVELSPQNFFRTVLALGRRRLGHADLARAQLPREGRAQGTIPESVSSPTTLLPLPATPTKGHVGSPGRWGPRNLECVDPSRRLPVRPVSPTRPATAAHLARLAASAQRHPYPVSPSNRRYNRHPRVTPQNSTVQLKDWEEATRVVPLSPKRPSASLRNSWEASPPSHNFLRPGRLQPTCERELRNCAPPTSFLFGWVRHPTPQPPFAVWLELAGPGRLGGLAYLAWCSRSPAPRSHEGAPSPNPESPKIPLSTSEEGRRRRAALPRKPSL